MFSNEYGEAAVEVLDILDNTNKTDVDKIPSNFIKFLVDNASEDYKVNLDHSKLISEMNLKEKTKEILGVIYINWWCDKKDKENYTKQIKELEIKRQEEIKEKYNPNKIFESKNKVQEYTNATKVDTVQNETVTMIEYKESIFKKIWNKILSFFNK
jgi:beta-glucosidase-like glycosyl hydrolase